MVELESFVARPGKNGGKRPLNLRKKAPQLMTTLDRLPWSEQKKIAAWTACKLVEGFSPSVIRIDDHGHIIRWSDHGKQSMYGWEIDHRNALALGGTDTLDNLRALHWRKNRELGGHVGNALNIFRQEMPSVLPLKRGRGLFGGGR